MLTIGSNKIRTPNLNFCELWIESALVTVFVASCILSLVSLVYYPLINTTGAALLGAVSWTALIGVLVGKAKKLKNEIKNCESKKCIYSPTVVKPPECPKTALESGHYFEPKNLLDITTADVLRWLTKEEIFQFQTLCKRAYILVVATSVLPVIESYGIRSTNLPSKNSVVHFYPGESECFVTNEEGWEEDIKSIKNRYPQEKVINIMRDWHAILLRNTDLTHFFNQLPPHYRQTFAPRIMKEKNKSYRGILLKNLLSRMFQMGNCGELASLTYTILKERLPLHAIYQKLAKSPATQDNQYFEGLHAFVLIEAGSGHIICCDAWANNAYPVELSHSCMSLTFTNPQSAHSYRRKFDRTVVVNDYGSPPSEIG